MAPAGIRMRVAQSSEGYAKRPSYSQKEPGDAGLWPTAAKGAMTVNASLGHICPTGNGQVWAWLVREKGVPLGQGCAALTEVSPPSTAGIVRIARI